MPCRLTEIRLAKRKSFGAGKKSFASSPVSFPAKQKSFMRKIAIKGFLPRIIWRRKKMQ
jgi:hypothetical protein